MTIKEKLGKKIYDYIKSQGLTVMTNESFDMQAKQIKVMEDAAVKFKDRLEGAKDIAIKWSLARQQIKVLEEKELQLVIWVIEEFDNKAIGKISQEDAESLIDEFNKLNNH